jgi:ABC-type microcin C transport system duplicated ATPase subunit YejF
MSHLLRISDLHVSVEDLPILNGVDLEIRTGEIHALMGPNGSNWRFATKRGTSSAPRSRRPFVPKWRKAKA